MIFYLLLMIKTKENTHTHTHTHTQREGMFGKVCYGSANPL
jgi:hypothetical protein